MRLFISIQFPEEIKNQLCMVIEKLKADANSGNFTVRKNLHLTLVFLGEVSKAQLPSIQTIMDHITAAPFLLKLENCGAFRRPEGDIYWVGVKPGQELFQIQSYLTQALCRAGFQVEQRPYRPHITLGRRVMTNVPPEVEGMQMKVCRISLMKSERIHGKLTYTELYQKALSVQKSNHEV